MKLAIVIPDGMADWPDRCPGGTPLERARRPVMDLLAREGEVGLTMTVPASVAIGSDAANMAVLGVEPGVRRIGRAAIEAAGRGVEVRPGEVVFRANLVRVEGDVLTDGVMLDYSGGALVGEEGRPLIDALRPALRELGAELHMGVGYRHLLVLPDETGELEALATTPPHDIQGKPTLDHLPAGPGAERLRAVMRKASATLAALAGPRKANAVWLWGQGSKVELPTLAERFGLTGAVISAVDLVRGLGRAMGMDVIEVPGATGDLDTNYAGKGAAAAEALERYDVVFCHVEAPDEAGHRGDAEGKREAIEAVDREVLARVHKAAKERGDTRVLVLPDHLTPLSIKTHAHGMVPYVLWGPGVEARPSPEFTERGAASTGFTIERGWELIGRALGRSPGSAGTI